MKKFHFSISTGDFTNRKKKTILGQRIFFIIQKNIFNIRLKYVTLWNFSLLSFDLFSQWVVMINYYFLSAKKVLHVFVFKTQDFYSAELSKCLIHKKGIACNVCEKGGTRIEVFLFFINHSNTNYSKLRIPSIETKQATMGIMTSMIVLTSKQLFTSSRVV